MEPCSCATSNMEPLSPDPSIQSLRNNQNYSRTRKYLLERIKQPGKFPKAGKEVFDCCLSCPVAPLQRFHNRPTDFYFIYKRILKRIIRNPVTITKKLYNFSKLISASNRGNAIIIEYPVFANIDVSNVCNLRCPECLVGTGMYKQPRGFIELKRYQDILKEIGHYLLYLELYRYGEPLLHKDLLQMIELAEKKYAIITQVSTNFAMPLSEDFMHGLVSSGLSSLVIASDDIDQDRYARYRKGGNVNNVIQNIRNLVKFKKEMNSSTPWINWQSLVFNFNEDRIDIITKYVKDLGVDYIHFRPAYLSPANYNLRPESGTRRAGAHEPKSAQILNGKVAPSKIDRNGKFALQVEVVNDLFDDEIAISEKDTGVRIGIKLADENKNEITDFERILFVQPLKPQEKTILTKELPYPRLKNIEKVSYLKIDLLMEGQYWFEDNPETLSRPYYVALKFQK